MKKYFLLLFCLAVWLPVSGREGRDVSFTLTHNITWGDSTTRIKLLVLVPANIDNQQHIRSVSYSLQPDSIYSKNGDTYALYMLNGGNKPSKITIDLDATVYPYDYTNARKLREMDKSGIIIDTANLARYLQNELFIESDDPAIRDLAIGLKGNDRTQTVSNIYHFVKENIRYAGYISAIQGAATTLRKKSGDCTDFTSLMVALCRSSSIPARSVYGYVTQWGNTPKHEWAEVFFENLGWVAFDPTSENASFDKMNPVIYVTKNFINTDLSIVYPNGYYFSYRYWGQRAQFELSFSIKE